MNRYRLTVDIELPVDEHHDGVFVFDNNLQHVMACASALTREWARHGGRITRISAEPLKEDE